MKNKYEQLLYDFAKLKEKIITLWESSVKSDELLNGIEKLYHEVKEHEKQI